MASFSSCSDVIGKDSGSLAKRLQALVRRVSVDRATVSPASGEMPTPPHHGQGLRFLAAFEGNEGYDLG
jgi:hypothetical protein